MMITKAKVIQSLLWKLGERGGTQGIQLIVMIVLTRLLLPEDFGLVAIVTIFISIAGLLVEGGFNEALIQKKNSNELDFSSVFYLNLFIASVLYILIYLSASIIGDFFEEPQLVTILRVISLILFINPFTSVQYAIISRNMQFKILFKSSLLAVTISGIVGLLLAFANFGVWALVGQQLTSQLLIAIFLSFTVNWRPKLAFSLNSVLKLFSFGWKLVVSTLIYTIYTNLQSMVVGKIFGSAILGFYSKGIQLPNILVLNINGSIQTVMFPALAAHQDDKKRVKEMMRRSIVTSSFILFPIMVGLAIIAEPLVILLFTENWLPSVPFIQIFCGYYALWTIDAANLHVIKALGRSDIFLKLEIIKFFIGILILCISLSFSIHVVAFGVLVNRIISTIMDAYPNKYLIHFNFLEQLKNTIPSIILSLVMGAVVYSINWLEFSKIITILIQIAVGTFVYLGLAMLFKIECFTYLLGSVKELISRKKEVIN